MYEDWKTLAASSKRNNRGESIGHESASPRPDSGGTVLYAICRAFLPKLITDMLMIGIRAYLVEPPVCPFHLRKRARSADSCGRSVSPFRCRELRDMGKVRESFSRDL